MSALYSSPTFLITYIELFSVSLYSLYRPIFAFKLVFTFILNIYNVFTQVRMQALKCFSVLSFENPQVSVTLVNGKYNVAVGLFDTHFVDWLN